MDDPGHEASPFWIGVDAATDFAKQGSALMRWVHDARPAAPDRQTVNLELIDTDEFEAYTTFEKSTSTVHFSRGWIVYAYEALIGASMVEEWPLLLSTAGAARAAAASGKSAEQVAALTKYLSSIELAVIAFRFVYLHEYFHASLGHTRFLSEQFGRNAFATRPLASETNETRKIRTAFELEADACAINTIAGELFTGRFDTLFASRGIGVVAIGFAIELMYMMNLELTAGFSRGSWNDLFTFDDPGVYPHPIKRRFYILAKLLASCQDRDLARAFENGIEYGASVARTCYRAVALSPASPSTATDREDDTALTRHVLELSRLTTTGQAMIDPTDWVRSYDAILRRVRPELSNSTSPDAYRLLFAL